jgi:hypothetical protein
MSADQIDCTRSARLLTELSLAKIGIAIKAKGAGRFEARVERDDRILCVSTTPFLKAARQLIDEGYDSSSILSMRYASSDTECLRGKLGVVAALTVEDTDYGPRFRRWKALSTLAVQPRSACFQQGATTLPSPASGALRPRGVK